jgi:protein-tyrosine phosphatase
MVAELLRAVRRTPERLMHALRQRAARAAVRGRGTPRTVLVLCHGNICRSPFTARLLERALAPAGIRVLQAGFIGAGRPAPAEAVVAARGRDLDLSEHRSQPLTSDLVGRADLVVVMDADQRRAVCDLFGARPDQVVLLGDFDPDPIDARAIYDPVDQAVEVFDAVYTRIERCVSELANTLLTTARGRHSEPSR